jgi:hypothetical protein
MTLNDGLESYVCFILTVEFVYDYIWNSREARKKRSQKKVKYEMLPTEGESK